MNQPNTTPIRIFIGSSPKNTIEESVFRYTLQKYTPGPIEIYVMDGQAGTATRLDTGEVQQLPLDVIGRIKGATAFSLARWAIPQWCNYQGKAIYCDSDQIILTDLAELWHYDFGDATLAAVSVRQAKSNPHYIKHFLRDFLQTNDECYLASVMLIDCEKAACWSLESLVDLLDRDVFSLPELMYLRSRFRDHFQLKVNHLPCVWNHLDYVDADSRIVHFTDLTSQPWLFHHNPTSDLWEQIFLEAVEQGWLTQAEITDAYNQGWISQRIKTLPFLEKDVRQPINLLWRSGNAFLFMIGQFFVDQFKLLRKVAYKLRMVLGLSKRVGA
jgi:lipopolysaccharide biosynthesis glycosyltransferase